MSKMDGRKKQTIKYQQIADDIRLKILSGIYAKNEMLPSEKKLGEKYQVSRLTIRNMLSLLENQGYIYTKAGKGSFIKEITNDAYAIDMDINNILNEGYDKVALIQAKMITPDIDLVYELQVSRNNRIVYMDWCIYKNNQVVGYDERFIPYFKGLPIDEKDLTYTSLKEMIKNYYNEFNEDIYFTGIIPDERIKNRLKFDSKKKDSVLLIEHKIYDNKSIPLGLNRLYLVAEESGIKGVFNI